MSEIIDYSIYCHAVRLPYSSDDEDEGIVANKMETQIKAGAHFLNVKLGSVQACLREGELLYNKYHKQGSYCGVNTQIIWDYYKNPKTPYQTALFCAFCATRSIIGKAAYKRTNKKLIIARMFGYSTFNDFEKDAPIMNVRNISKEEKERRMIVAECRQKYCNRYHIDKILTDLELYWGLKRYADHIRGMYISYEYNLITLAKICENSKRTVKINALKEEKRQAKLAAQDTTP